MTSTESGPESPLPLPLGDELDEAKENDDFERLATIYITRATYLLVQTAYQPGAWFRRAAGMALLAISYDGRITNTNRVKGHLMLFEDAFLRMATEEEHAIAKGFGYEWLGDARLMFGDPDGAKEFYREAKPQYENHDWETRWAWGGRQGGEVVNDP
jgi:hypothetical protein